MALQKLVTLAASDGTVKIWDVAQKELMATLPRKGGAV